MVNMNKHIDPCIYALHIGDGLLHYIGSTSKNPLNRMWEHIYRARSGHTAPVYDWMREVGIDNVQVAVLRKEPDAGNRKITEAQFIADLLAEGHPLKNQISRDGNLNSMSATSRAKIGEANRGKPSWISGKTGEDAGWTEERRALQSARMKKKGAAA